MQPLRPNNSGKIPVPTILLDEAVRSQVAAVLRRPVGHIYDIAINRPVDHTPKMRGTYN